MFFVELLRRAYCTSLYAIARNWRRRKGKYRHIKDAIKESEIAIAEPVRLQRYYVPLEMYRSDKYRMTLKYNIKK